jgi:putative phosphoesterase
MRLAVISDIHGNIAALEAVLDDIGRRNVDVLVNLGDCLSGPFDAVATADRLMALDLPTVRGNHDRQLYDRAAEEMGLWERWIIEDLTPSHLDWLRSFPPVLTYEGVLLCHGTPASDEENWLDARTDMNRMVARDLSEVEQRASGVIENAVLCGHTHTQRFVRLPDGKAILNPGSVGCPAYLDTRSTPHFVHQTGAIDARYAILERRGGVYRSELHAVPYDPTEMILLAEQRGAEGWARALSKGWIA